MKNNLNKTAADGVPLSLSEVMAGFPSPADDFLEGDLNFNEYLVKNPPSTFCVRVKGESMTGAGIFPGDILVVDRSLEACHRQIVIAAVDGELTVKRLLRSQKSWILAAENNQYRPVSVDTESELLVWGVVTAVIRRLSR